MNVGEKIREIRLSKGLSQERLGNLCGMAGSAIRRYESGRANPKIETLTKIASALEVPVWEILGMNKQEAILMHGNDRLNTTPYSTEDISNAIRKDVLYEMDLRKLKKAFDSLNRAGQKESVKRVQELTEISKYRKDSS